MTAARGFARYLAGIDASTEVLDESAKRSYVGVLT
jgi:hypothetical protein